MKLYSMGLKDRISSKRRNKIVKYLSSNRNTFPIKDMLSIASYLVYGGQNVSYDSSSNGENELFKVLAKVGIKTIIDCGANEGTNTKVYKTLAPDAQIFCVEAIEETMEKCKEFTKDLTNVSYHNIGMGNKHDKITFKYYPKHLYLSTRYENTTGREMEVKTQEVEIFTGDEFCDINNISKVDFLKIDVEGMDFQVIEGFKNKLQQKKVKAIQFEYGQSFILAHTFLKDVYDFIKPLGYKMGKIYPDGVEFSEYNIKMDNFLEANYIIIDEKEEELINQLKSF